MSRKSYRRKLIRYIIAGAVCLIAFAVLMGVLMTTDRCEYVIRDLEGNETGTRIVIGLSSLNLFANTLIGGYHESMHKISSLLELASYASVGLLMLTALVQLIKDRRFSRTFFALAAMYAAVAVCYFAFECFVINCRPLDLGEGAEASFPSSHSMFSVALLGAAGIECRLLNKKLGKVMKPVCYALAAATCVCRFVSGVHWVTDIMGGVLLGLGLACFFAAGASALKHSERKERNTRA